MPIFRFKCVCGNIYEEIMSKSVKQIDFPNCSRKAKLIPSSPYFKHMKEKRKEVLKQMTGTEINSIEDEEKYLKRHNLMTVSKREWQEIKAKRDSMWNNYSFNKQEVQKNMVEGIKEVVENIEKRRMVNKYNLEKRKETEEILNKKLEGAEI